MAPSTSSVRLMRVVVVLLLLFPVLLKANEAPPFSVKAQLILTACKSVGEGSTYFDVQFCEGAIGSVIGGSADLDYQVFGGIAVRLLAENATSTKAKIDRLLRGGGSVKLKAEDDVTVARCLQSCQSLYGGILYDWLACTAAVKTKLFGEARRILEKAAAAAKECEDGFGKNNVASPLSAEDDDAFKLAKLGVAFLRLA
jgi:pectinesterase inhibitor-like protein